MAVLVRHLRPLSSRTYASSRLVSFRVHLRNLKTPSRSPLSSLFLNARGFVGYPRKYDAGVFRAAGSYRDVHEMADAPTDSSEQKKNYLVYTRPREHDPVLLKASYVDMLVLLLGSKEAALKAIVSCSKSTFVFCRGLTGLFKANLTGLQAKTLAGFPGVVNCNVGGAESEPSYRFRCLGLLLLFAQ